MKHWSALLLAVSCSQGPALRQPVGRTPSEPAGTGLAPAAAGDTASTAQAVASPPAPSPSPRPHPAAPVTAPQPPNATCDLPDTALEAPLFASNEAALRKRGTQILDGVVACYEAGLYQGQQLVLTGYSDPRGSPAHNRQLALARASAVRRYLIRRGLPPERIEIASAGASRYRGTGPESWMYDRRVEITSRQAPGEETAPPERAAPVPPPL